MIHVAPCSCELHVRIRELEAELESVDEALNFSFLPGQTRQSIIVSIRAAAVDHANQKARAEKAEKERDELQAYIDKFGWNSDAKDRIAEVKRLDARVAELVDEINLIIRHYKIEDYDLSVLRESQEVYHYKDGRTIPVVRERKPAPASEGHEREAD